LIAAEPADRRALARVGSLILDPQPASFRRGSASSVSPARTSRNMRMPRTTRRHAPTRTAIRSAEQPARSRLAGWGLAFPSRALGTVNPISAARRNRDDSAPAVLVPPAGARSVDQAWRTRRHSSSSSLDDRIGPRDISDRCAGHFAGACRDHPDRVRKVCPGGRTLR
jgi:hypothetical protein